MNCPDPKCRGESDFWRHSLDGLSEIHICGECGGEWGIAIAKKGGGDLKALGVDVHEHNMTAVVQHRADWERELQSDVAQLKYPSKAKALIFTTMDAEMLRGQAEEMRRFRLAIDEAEFFGEF